MENIVFISQKGNPITNSLLVADHFGKKHKDVLRALKNLIQSAQNCAHFYHSDTYKDSRNRSQEMFLMTRDGFILLVMGFTGKEATQFKINFINAFNNLESQLNAALQEKAQFADKITASEDTVDLGEACKLLKLPYGRNTFLKQLRNKGIFFNTRNEPKQQYINHGYFEFSEIPYENKGKTYMNTKTTVTQSGLEWLNNKVFNTTNPAVKLLKALSTNQQKAS